MLFFILGFLRFASKLLRLGLKLGYLVLLKSDQLVLSSVLLLQALKLLNSYHWVFTHHLLHVVYLLLKSFNMQFQLMLVSDMRSDIALQLLNHLLISLYQL